MYSTDVELRNILYNNYSDLLKSIGIIHYKLMGFPHVWFVFKLRNKILLNSVDNETRNKLLNYKLYLQLSIIGVILFGTFAILTVLLAGR